MSTVALTGNDTFVLNNRVFTDFADAMYAELTYPNDIASVKTGKNGNSIYGYNASGRQGEIKLRLVRGSSDDKFMLGLLAAQQAAFENTVLMIGQFIKKIGDGTGVAGSDTYICSGGIFAKQPGAKSNAEGETEQSVVEYDIKFSNIVRVIT